MNTYLLKNHGFWKKIKDFSLKQNCFEFADRTAFQCLPILWTLHQPLRQSLVSLRLGNPPQWPHIRWILQVLQLFLVSLHHGRPVLRKMILRRTRNQRTKLQISPWVDLLRICLLQFRVIIDAPVFEKTAVNRFILTEKPVLIG